MILRALLTITLLLELGHAWAGVPVSVTGARDPDMAKRHMVQKAILGAIDELAPEVGFDAENFKATLFSKFEEHFARYKQQMVAEKFGKDHFQNLDPEAQKNYLNALDEHRTEEFLKFTKLESVLENLRIENLEKTPEGYRATLDFTVNRALLTAYVKRLNNRGRKEFSGIHLLTTIVSTNFSFSDLGYRDVEKFKGPIKTSWLKWLDNNLPTNVEEAVSCEADCATYFSEWLTRPGGQGTPELYRNGLWLRINLRVRREILSEKLNEVAFSWDGSLILQDINTKRILLSHDIPTTRKSWIGLAPRNLSTVLANNLYAAALVPLAELPKLTEASKVVNRCFKLEIQGHRNILDVVQLSEKIRMEAGIHLSISGFDQKAASLLGCHPGEEKSFSDLLSRVNELKSSERFKLVHEFNGTNHVIKLLRD